MKSVRLFSLVLSLVIFLLLPGCHQSQAFSQQGLPLDKMLETYSQLYGCGYDTVVKTLNLTGMKEYIKGTGVWVPEQHLEVCGHTFQQGFSIDPETDSLWSISYVYETNNADEFGDLVENVIDEAQMVYGVPLDGGYTPKLSSDGAIERIKAGKLGSWFEGWILDNNVGLTVAVSVQEKSDILFHLSLEFFPNGQFE